MAGLVLEGGTFRPIFSAGVMDALLDNNIMFPYVIGVSAGITNGVSYISRQKGRNLEVLEKYRNDKRYMGACNFIKCRSIFGLDFVFNEIPNHLVPFDMDTYLSYEGKVLIGVTNAATGMPEYIDGRELDDKCTILRATCAIPLFFPAICYKGQHYYDGGVSDPIPVRKSLSDGNEYNLIVLTRPYSYTKEYSRQNALASRLLSKKYPAMTTPLTTRHTSYNETVHFCNELEKQGKAVILRPDESEAIDSFEKDVEKIRRGYAHGYETATKNINKIKDIYKQNNSQASILN